MFLFVNNWIRIFFKCTVANSRPGIDERPAVLVGNTSSARANGMEVAGALEVIGYDAFLPAPGIWQ